MTNEPSASVAVVKAGISTGRKRIDNKKENTIAGILKMMKRALAPISLTILFHPEMKKRATGPLAL